MFLSPDLGRVFWLQTVNVEEFIVLEDEYDAIKEITNELRRQGAEKILLAHTKEKTESYIQPGKRQVFMLDIDLGYQHERDGFKAALRVREENPEAFVGILSKRSNVLLMQHAKQANVVFIPKPLGDLAKGVRIMLLETAKYFRDSFVVKAAEIESVIEEFDRHLPDDSYRNTQEFYIKQQDEQWFENHVGYYVAFVEGEHIATQENQEELIQAMEQLYPDALVLIVRVGDEEETLDIPTVFVD